MNSDERQLITDLFARMQGHGAVEKDAQAAALINERVRAMPDAAYMLVQSVLIQEMALQQAEARMRELESRVADLERAPPPSGSSGGSFLGGMLGGGRAAEARHQGGGAVPITGRPMGGGGARPAAQPAARPSTPWGQQPGAQAGVMPQQAGGGGFMRSAMATAAGVAGGMLLADGIRSMMGGSSTPAATTASNETAASEPAADATDYQDGSDNDPGIQDAGYDDSADFGGDFDV